MLGIGLVDRDRHSVDCLEKWGAVVDMCVSTAASALWPGYWAALFFPSRRQGCTARVYLHPDSVVSGLRLLVFADYHTAHG